MRVEAIVNAANSTLLGGGGVDGAIHRAAGPGLLQECRALGCCPTGEARLTRGYNLPARFVIHTVGPVWMGGGRRDDEMLARCYRSCFGLVAAHRIRSVAFPSISTGAYGFPIERASRIALGEIKAFMEEEGDTEEGGVEVRVVCFSSPDYLVYQGARREVFGA